MKRTIAPTTLVPLFSPRCSFWASCPRLRLRSTENAPTPACKAASDSPTQEPISRSRRPLAGPIAQIGRQSFDGRGNTHGTGTLSAKRQHPQSDRSRHVRGESGLYGSLTLFVSPFGTTVNADFVIDDDGAEVRALVTDAGAIESLVFKKQFPGGPRE